MNETELQKAVTKILNTTLPKEFEFIERVEDVILHRVSLAYNVSLAIFLNKNWVEKNFSEDAMTLINQDFESFGYSALSNFTAAVYSDLKIDSEKIKGYIYSIISFLGLKYNINNMSIKYIVEDN